MTDTHDTGERPWTVAEETFLARWSGSFPLTKLAVALERSPAEVIRQLDRTAPGHLLSAAALARCLCCSPGTVRRARHPGTPTPTAGDSAVIAAPIEHSPAVALPPAVPEAPPAPRRRQGRPVVAVAEPGQPAVLYPSAADAAEALGVHRNAINKAARGQSRAAGRLWAYLGEVQPVVPTPEDEAADEVDPAVRVLIERRAAGLPLKRIDRAPPEAIRVPGDEAERAYRRQQELEAELTEQEPWRPVLAGIRSKRA